MKARLESTKFLIGPPSESPKGQITHLPHFILPADIRKTAPQGLLALHTYEFAYLRHSPECAQHLVYPDIYVLIVSACNFTPSAWITFRMVAKLGLPSPDSAL